MRPLPDAQREVLDAVGPQGPVRRSVWDALGTVLAADVTAPHDVPPFANSAMDGYAVRAVDTVGAPVELRVTEDVAAGHVATATVEPGSAIKIMTGAPVPAGADAIVEVEATEPGDGSVRILTTTTPGTHVRPAGGDVAEGTTVFLSGTRLGPAHLGVLSTLGVAAPLVHAPPRVAILSTGDEVLPPEAETLSPGRIRDANRPLLVGLLRELGVDHRDFGIVPDDRDLLRDTLLGAAGECDVIVTSGGVSMGEYDLVKQVLTELGDVDLWRVAMKPAKPFAFGTVAGTPLFGLPGNPVSVLVAFEQFLRPALLTMMGARAVFRPRLRGTLAESVHTDPEKVVFLRVVLSYEGSDWVARLAGGQSSNVLSAAAAADALAVVPVGVDSLSAGDAVELEMIHWPESRTRAEVLDG